MTDKSEMPYPTSGAPYPTSGAPYPTSGAPYPTSGAPYPTSVAPYPSSGAPYPTSGAPSPSSGAPFPTSGAPPYQNQGYAPYPTGHAQQTPGIIPSASNQYAPPPVAPPSYETTTTSATVAIVNVSEYEPKAHDDMFSFNDKSVRLGFVRKVYGILALQMAVTIAMSCLFMFHEPTKYFVQNHLGVYIGAYVTFFVLYIVLACCTNVARNYPCNMVLLTIFTLSLSYLVAAITSFHDTKIVLMVFGITLIVCTAVMLFACQTKYDFTTCGGLLFVLTLCLIFFGIFAGIFIPLGSIRTINMVYAGLGALLFMAFLAFDTQLIMGGKKYEISPEDYVFAAMMLYVDIIYIFLFLLSLFGGKN